MDINISKNELKGLFPQMEIKRERRPVIYSSSVKAQYHVDCQALYNKTDVIDTQHTLIEYATPPLMREHIAYPTEEEVIPSVLKVFSSFKMVPQSLNELLAHMEITDVGFGSETLLTQMCVGHEVLGGVLLGPGVSDEYLRKACLLLEDTCKSLSGFISETYSNLMLRIFEKIRLFDDNKLSKDEKDNIKGETVRNVKHHASRWRELFSRMR
jgi:hypothetical protein